MGQFDVIGFVGSGGHFTLSTIIWEARRDDRPPKMLDLFCFEFAGFDDDFIGVMSDGHETLCITLEHTISTIRVD